jgi:hypothetical protein
VGGRVVRREGSGRQAPGVSRQVVSHSRAITAACTVKRKGLEMGCLYHHLQQAFHLTSPCRQAQPRARATPPTLSYQAPPSCSPATPRPTCGVDPQLKVVGSAAQELPHPRAQLGPHAHTGQAVQVTLLPRQVRLRYRREGRGRASEMVMLTG